MTPYSATIFHFTYFTIHIYSVWDIIANHKKRFGVSYFEYMGFPGRLKYSTDWLIVRLKYKSFLDMLDIKSIN